VVRARDGRHGYGERETGENLCETGCSAAVTAAERFRRSHDGKMTHLPNRTLCMWFESGQRNRASTYTSDADTVLFVSPFRPQVGRTYGVRVLHTYVVILAVVRRRGVSTRVQCGMPRLGSQERMERAHERTRAEMTPDEARLCALKSQMNATYAALAATKSARRDTTEEFIESLKAVNAYGQALVEKERREGAEAQRGAQSRKHPTAPSYVPTMTRVHLGSRIASVVDGKAAQTHTKAKVRAIASRMTKPSAKDARPYARKRFEMHIGKLPSSPLVAEDKPVPKRPSLLDD